MLNYPASLVSVNQRQFKVVEMIRNEWTESFGTGGRFAPEWVVEMKRNEWSIWTGICN